MTRRRVHTTTLSPREVAVIRCVARGLRNHEVAGELGIGVETVKTHVRRILGKLEAVSRVDAVRLAYRRGYLPRPVVDVHLPEREVAA